MRSYPLSPSGTDLFLSFFSFILPLQSLIVSLRLVGSQGGEQSHPGWGPAKPGRGRRCGGRGLKYSTLLIHHTFWVVVLCLPCGLPRKQWSVEDLRKRLTCMVTVYRFLVMSKGVLAEIVKSNIYVNRLRNHFTTYYRFVIIIIIINLRTVGPSFSCFYCPVPKGVCRVSESVRPPEGGVLT